MSAELIALAVERNIFQPRHQFDELATDHVPFDSLTRSCRFEDKALRAVTGGERAVGVLGPRGGGKSSLIAYVCHQLPETHTALRVPVSGADDPTSVNVMGAVALSQALHDIEMDERYRQELERARADGHVLEETPGKIGGTLGGGPVPAAVHVELGTLRNELQIKSQAVERLAGLERLISILVAQGRCPVFVLEDTEAAIGADPEDAGGFFAGPVHAFINELDASFLIAVQDPIAASPAFRDMAGALALVELPGLAEADVVPALVRIVENRLAQHDAPERAASHLLTDEALQTLASLYEESGGNLRATLAVVQSACEYARESAADLVGAGRVRAAANDWRERYRG